MKTELARNIDGVVAPFYLAYRVSHRWGGALEGHSEKHETLLDADVDAERLRQRINTHYALERIVSFERGNKHEIPAFAMSSAPRFGSGGGCNYNAHIEIRPAPVLKTKVCAACDGKGHIVVYGPRCTVCDGAGIV